MDRESSKDRKAFVVISRNQTKIWNDLADKNVVAQTVYERSAIPKSFMKREFNLRNISRSVLSRFTTRLDDRYAARIAARLEGVDQVFVVGQGSRRGGRVNEFARLLHREEVLPSSRIHALKNIDPERMNDRELLAMARKMGSQLA
jgi:hypothetical protein